MRKLTLIRIAYTLDGTFGIFLDHDNSPICLTLEREWKNNQRGISCIPTGVYTCKRIVSPKFGETFTILKVPDRKLIRIHWGNIEDDTHGCVVIGLKPGRHKGKVAVKSSKLAFSNFMTLLNPDDWFELEIKDGI